MGNGTKTKPLSMIKAEQEDPIAVVSTCCQNQTGLLVQINKTWWLLRNKPIGPGKLASTADRVNVCRGCYRVLNDAGDVPGRPWVFGLDEQIDEHIRQIAREMRGRK